jgi:hypothetical protein
VALSQGVAAKLASIRKAFNLSSNAQAATLSVRVYESLCDNLWRGNVLSIVGKEGQSSLLDTDKIKAELVRCRNP